MTARACVPLSAALALLIPVAAAAQTAPAPRPAQPTPAQSTPVRPPQSPPAQPRQGTGTASTGMPIPTDYIIGPDDVLNIVFWRDADMTQEVTVRPDGNITLPLMGDIKAAGLKPTELRELVATSASKFIEDPNVTVVVKQINSRNVFIMGGVTRPGPYPVSGQMTVAQLIAVAGGLTEFADAGNIRILRVENGKTTSLKFNYNDVMDGKKLEQNIDLKPGDTVMVKQ
jgi:polysaccharide export outer membrane protein